MTVAGQMQVFLAMLLCGAAVGMAHDLMALFRHGLVFTAAADLALGLVCAAGMIGVGLALYIDPFRLYVFAGVCLGWTIYVLTLGTIVRVLKKRFINLSKKVTN